MTNYNQQLNELFNEWEVQSQKDGHTAFCRDGLMRKYGQPPNYVDELWDKSEKRIMFLVKDQPTEWSDDTRNWLINDNGNAKKNAEKTRSLKPKFFKVLAYMLYGLSNTKGHNIPDLEEITHEHLMNCFNEIPFAFVESKKQGGRSRITDKELRNFINRYEGYLVKEINILNPDIIVCFGNPQYYFLLNKLYGGAEKIDNNVYFHREKKKLIFYSYHPSYNRGIWRYPETFYADLMTQYKKFLEK